VVLLQRNIPIIKAMEFVIYLTSKKVQKIKLETNLIYGAYYCDIWIAERREDEDRQIGEVSNH
jgi:hypothetical protein